MFNHGLKKNMSTFFLVVVMLLVVYMIYNHRPGQVSVEELSNWFSARFDEISANAEADISLEKQGHYRHKGMQNFASIGKITYELLDKNYSRFELAELQAITKKDLESTEGFRRLKRWAGEAGVSVKLAEVTTEGDGVTSWDDVDEYIDDIPRYYTVTLSGW